MTTPRNILATTARALLLLAALASPAGAGHLLGLRSNALYTVDVAGAEPVVHGPFLAGALGSVEDFQVLRDDSAALVLSRTHLYRVDLSDPLAPAIAASVLLPFPPVDLLEAGCRDYVLLLGTLGRLAVIDLRSLAFRQTFTLPDRREGGELSPDGRSLVTFRTTSPHYVLSRFDPATGPGPQSPLTYVFGNVDLRKAAFSPDGRTLVIVENSYWFRPAEPEGFPPFYQPFLNTYEIEAPGQAVFRQDHYPSGDAIVDLAFSRDSRRVFFAQGANPEYSEPDRLLRYEIGAAGVLQAGRPIPLTEEGIGVGRMGRAAGGKEIYLPTSRQIGPSSYLAELHRFRPADGTLETFVPNIAVGLATFEIAAPVFADGFELGSTGAWSDTYP